MSDPDAVVTDTHPLLFHAAGGSRLGRRAARVFERCEHDDAIIYVPAAVLWECSLLVRAGRVSVQQTLRSFFDDLFSHAGFQPLDLTPEQVFVADDLGLTHDPFDALIAGAAVNLGVPLVTRDRRLQDSAALRTVW